MARFGLEGINLLKMKSEAAHGPADNIKQDTFTIPELKETYKFLHHQAKGVRCPHKNPTSVEYVCREFFHDLKNATQAMDKAALVITLMHPCLFGLYIIVGVDSVA